MKRKYSCPSCGVERHVSYDVVTHWLRKHPKAEEYGATCFGCRGKRLGEARRGRVPMTPRIEVTCNLCGERRSVKRGVVVKWFSEYPNTEKYGRLCRSCSQIKEGPSPKEKVLVICPNCGTERLVTRATIRQWIKEHPETEEYGANCTYCDPLTSEQRKRQLASVTGRRHTEEEIEKVRRANKGRKFSEETRRKMSESAKVRIRYPHRPESIEKMRKVAMGKHPTEETRRKLREATVGTKRRVGLRNTPEAKANMSKAQKKVWSDPDYARKQQQRMKRAQTVRPTEPERKVVEILTELYGEEWKYVGDGSVEIGGLFPDFIHRNGRKMLIEVFGDWWHREGAVSYHQTEQGRIEAYAEHGYSTLIIWESELTKPEEVTSKIQSFAGDV